MSQHKKGVIAALRHPAAERLPECAPPLVLRDSDRGELERRTRLASGPASAARRARIVVLAADGVANARIRRRLDHPAFVTETLAPPPKKLGVTHWSPRLLADRLRISHKSVARAWSSHGQQLQPVRRRYHVHPDGRHEATWTNGVSSEGLLGDLALSSRTGFTSPTRNCVEIEFGRGGLCGRCGDSSTPGVLIARPPR